MEVRWPVLVNLRAGIKSPTSQVNLPPAFQPRRTGKISFRASSVYTLIMAISVVRYDRRVDPRGHGPHRAGRRIVGSTSAEKIKFRYFF